MDLGDAQLYITAAAVLAALVYLGKKLLVIVQAVLAIHAIVQRELEHNHGSSIKDDIYGMARSFGETQRLLDDVVEALRRQHPDDPLFRQLKGHHR